MSDHDSLGYVLDVGAAVHREGAATHRRALSALGAVAAAYRIAPGAVAALHDHASVDVVLERAFAVTARALCRPDRSLVGTG